MAKTLPVILILLLSGCVTVQDWRPRFEQQDGYIEVEVDRDAIVVERVWRL